MIKKFDGVEHVYYESTEAGADASTLEESGRPTRSPTGWSRRDQWKKLTSVIVVEATRRLLGENKVGTSRRYYISSLPCQSGQRFATLIRDHWSIENAQHWTLDMAFNRDQTACENTTATRTWRYCVESQWDCSGGTRA